MSFTPQFLDEIRARQPLSDLIGRRVKLVRKGREYAGLCPFHSEKTASFTVNDDKGFFHCFGCGAHGDVIGFEMRIDNLSFPEAVERLALGAGLALPEHRPGDRERSKQRQSIYEVVEKACAWFEAQLAGTGGRAAREYLAGRGLDDATVARFRLGWAPDSRNAHKRALIADGVTEAALVEAGLLIQPEGGGAPYDRFRGRIIFPIADRSGRMIAFGGRAMGDGVPKYLNSPETPLFHKGAMLYGYALARKPAHDAGEVIVAEGYMDVIALARGGFPHAVAPLGTALTEDQMRELWRLAPEPVLCFDGDAAGQRAAGKAVGRALPLLGSGRSLRFATMPPGEDPDSLLVKRGAGALAEVFAAARPLADMLWQIETEGRRLDTPERRADLEKRLYEQVGRIEDATVRGHYQRDVKSRLWKAFRGEGRPQRGQDRSQGRSGGRTWGRSAPGRSGGPSPWLPEPPIPDPLGSGSEGLGEPRERRLVAMILGHPALLAAVGEEFGGIELVSPELDRLRNAILELSFDVPELETGALKSHLSSQGHEAVVERLSGAMGWSGRRFGDSPGKPEMPLEELEFEWRHVLSRHREAATLGAELRAAEQELAEHMTEDALERLNALKRAQERSAGVDLDFDGFGTALGRNDAV